MEPGEVYQRSSSQYAPIPQQQQQQPMPGGTFFQDGGVPFSPPNISNMANDPMATAAIHYGSHLAQTGGEYMQQNLNQFVATHRFKYYFAVDTNYVLRKLGILMFPFIHKDWSCHYNKAEPVAPRYDINAPDLYIPVMSFVTYTLLVGIMLGTQNRFSPEQLGFTSSSQLAWLLAEVGLVWLTLYVLGITSDLRWLDIVALLGYKYVSMIVCIGVAIAAGQSFYYIILIWTSITSTYFMIQSLRLSLQHTSEGYEGGGSRKRNYVLIITALLQPLLIFWLTWSLVHYQPPKLPQF
ncbi:protein YIF1B-B-like [Dysidea avara]|uniref:protein YIF1B-B-like n=1 Tax=Dysidea avara TaxID=196820 RepID=UPI003321978E